MSTDKVAQKGDKVKIDYAGKLSDGTIFDESKNHGGPLEFVIGDKKLLPDFEDAAIGMKVGEEKTITIPSEKAYGQRKEELIQKVDRKNLPENMEPAVGQQLKAKQQNGDEIIVTVVGVEDDKVTIDINHPLAGQDLVFNITLVEIL